MKVITLSGSMKFQKEMMNIATELELNGDVVIQCVYFPEDKKLSDSELALLSQLHYKKIEISDALYVVNVNGYIGTDTKKEIEYARSLHKEILSLEPFCEI
ncbi:MAG: hypothetical protein KH135_04035 [Firmicutes bacterium]|nr:hypothetical protein [Bacillota bacterium]